MADMRIRELWRFPVKSMGGEQIETGLVGPNGMVGDRVRGVFDLETGTVLTARRSPDLLFASARCDEDDVVVRLPDGTETADDAALSSWLKRDVSLIAPAEDGATYENPMDFENDADWVSWQGPAGSFHDSPKSMISLVSDASLGDWNLRRFRTNVLIGGNGEDGWVGRRVRIGDQLVLDVSKQIDRCVMVTRPQPGLDRDLDVLRTINRQRESKLSVGALIETAGSINVGDLVTTV